MDLLQDHNYEKRLQLSEGISVWGDRMFLLYIFTLPFLSAFALTPIFSIPFLISIVLFAWMLLAILVQQRFPAGFWGFDILFVLGIISVTVFSYLLNGRASGKSLNHTVAYVSTFLLFYISVKFTLFNSNRSRLLFQKVLKILTITVLVSTVYAIVEFVFNNFFGINLNDYIYRPSEGVAMYDATVLALFVRSRGFAVESGHFTFMMEMFSPLVVYYLYFSGFCNWSKLIKVLSLFAIILSFISAFSTASFIIVPLSFSISALLYLRPLFKFFKKHFVRVILVLVLIGFIFAVIHFTFPVFDLIIKSIQGKIGGGGYEYRRNNLDFFFTWFSRFEIAQKLIGIGPAGSLLLGFGESHAILNLYFSIAFEIGIAGILCLLLLILYCFFYLYKLPSPLNFFATASILAGLMHYYFIANYYYPWFWFVLVFIIFCNKRKVCR